MFKNILRKLFKKDFKNIENPVVERVYDNLDFKDLDEAIVYYSSDKFKHKLDFLKSFNLDDYIYFYDLDKIFRGDTPTSLLLDENNFIYYFSIRKGECSIFDDDEIYIDMNPYKDDIDEVYKPYICSCYGNCEKCLDKYKTDMLYHDDYEKNCLVYFNYTEKEVSRIKEVLKSRLDFILSLDLNYKYFNVIYNDNYHIYDDANKFIVKKHYKYLDLLIHFKFLNELSFYISNSDEETKYIWEFLLNKENNNVKYYTNKFIRVTDYSTLDVRSLENDTEIFKRPLFILEIKREQTTRKIEKDDYLYIWSSDVYYDSDIINDVETSETIYINDYTIYGFDFFKFYNILQYFNMYKEIIDKEIENLKDFEQILTSNTTLLELGVVENVLNFINKNNKIKFLPNNLKDEIDRESQKYRSLINQYLDSYMNNYRSNLRYNDAVEKVDFSQINFSADTISEKSEDSLNMLKQFNLNDYINLYKLELLNDKIYISENGELYILNLEFKNVEQKNICGCTCFESCLTCSTSGAYNFNQKFINYRNYTDEEINRLKELAKIREDLLNNLNFNSKGLNILVNSFYDKYSCADFTEDIEFYEIYNSHFQKVYPDLILKIFANILLLFSDYYRNLDKESKQIWAFIQNKKFENIRYKNNKTLEITTSFDKTKENTLEITENSITTYPDSYRSKERKYEKKTIISNKIDNFIYDFDFKKFYMVLDYVNLFISLDLQGFYQYTKLDNFYSAEEILKLKEFIENVSK